MFQKILVPCFLSLALVSGSVFASNEGKAHSDIADTLSPCLQECLKKDKELHQQTLTLENFQRNIVEKKEDCLLEDRKLHTQTLQIFMGNGRSKDSILKKIGSYFDQNSLTTLACLFGEMMKKDTQATQKCLSLCDDSEFKEVGEDL